MRGQIFRLIKKKNRIHPIGGQEVVDLLSEYFFIQIFISDLYGTRQELGDVREVQVSNFGRQGRQCGRSYRGG